MEKFKNILMVVGIVCILLVIVILIVGVKAVTTAFLWTVGALAALTLAGLLWYWIGKLLRKTEPTSPGRE